MPNQLFTESHIHTIPFSAATETFTMLYHSSQSTKITTSKTFPHHTSSPLSQKIQFLKPAHRPKLHLPFPIF